MSASPKMRAIIEKYGEDNPDEVFRSITTYKQLQDANVAFLQGKLSSTPYHGGSCEKLLHEFFASVENSVKKIT